jgi:hypothetical protein
MGGLPTYQPDPLLSITLTRRAKTRQKLSLAIFALSFIALFYLPFYWTLYSSPTATTRLPINAGDILSRCTSIKSSPGPPPDFYSRTQSDRFQQGTKPTLLKNATIWTGGDAGKEQITGDILLDGGIIKWIGRIEPRDAKRAYGQNIDIVYAHGAWLTPGCVVQRRIIGMALSSRCRVKNR